MVLIETNTAGAVTAERSSRTKKGFKKNVLTSQYPCHNMPSFCHHFCDASSFFRRFFSSLFISHPARGGRCNWHQFSAQHVRVLIFSSKTVSQQSVAKKPKHTVTRLYIKTAANIYFLHRLWRFLMWFRKPAGTEVSNCVYYCDLSSPLCLRGTN